KNPFHSLWVPILALVFMSMTAGIYEVNSLFKKSMRWHRNRRRTMLILKGITLLIMTIAIIATATLKLGNQFMLSVNEDDKTPNITTSIRDKLEQFKELDIPDQKILYGAFSEVHLRDLYAQDYRTTNNQVLADKKSLEPKPATKPKPKTDGSNLPLSPSVPPIPSPSLPREPVISPNYEVTTPTQEPLPTSSPSPQPISPPPSSEVTVTPTPSPSLPKEPVISPSYKVTTPTQEPLSTPSPSSQPISPPPSSGITPTPSSTPTPLPSSPDESEPIPKEPETLLKSNRNNPETKAILVQYDSNYETSTDLGNLLAG
ncbi:MAG: hypothetical protein ACRDEA_21690, partial [Microcystaceae cyanobacterium]